MTTATRLIVLIAFVGLFRCTNGIEIEGYQKVALHLHNHYRSWYQADDLSIDPELNEAAQKCAEYYYAKKSKDHTCPFKGGAGENLYYIRVNQTQPKKYVAIQAVTAWFTEIKGYNFYHPEVNCDKTSQFTQLVWGENKYLGFGVAGGYAVALYKSPINLCSIEDYKRNVLPQTEKQASCHRSGESSAASKMKISLNIVAIYSFAIFYVLPNVL